MCDMQKVPVSIPGIPSYKGTRMDGDVKEHSLRDSRELVFQECLLKDILT